MPDNKKQLWTTLGMLGELGFIIALPIVGLGLLGRFLDKKYDSSPIFLLIAVLLSLFISSAIVYFRVLKIAQKFK